MTKYVRKAWGASSRKEKSIGFIPKVLVFSWHEDIKTAVNIILEVGRWGIWKLWLCGSPGFLLMVTKQPCGCSSFKYYAFIPHLTHRGGLGDSGSTLCDVPYSFQEVKVFSRASNQYLLVFHWQELHQSHTPIACSGLRPKSS